MTIVSRFVGEVDWQTHSTSTLGTELMVRASALSSEFRVRYSWCNTVSGPESLEQVLSGSTSDLSSSQGHVVLYASILGLSLDQLHPCPSTLRYRIYHVREPSSCSSILYCNLATTSACRLVIIPIVPTWMLMLDVPLKMYDRGCLPPPSRGGQRSRVCLWPISPL